jgi:hypothetical protein
MTPLESAMISLLRSPITSGHQLQSSSDSGKRRALSLQDADGRSTRTPFSAATTRDPSGSRFVDRSVSAGRRMWTLVARFCLFRGETACRICLERWPTWAPEHQGRIAHRATRCTASASCDRRSIPRDLPDNESHGVSQ